MRIQQTWNLAAVEQCHSGTDMLRQRPDITSHPKCSRSRTEQMRDEISEEGQGEFAQPPSPEKQHCGEVRRHNARAAKNVTSKLSPGAVPLQPVSASPCSQRNAMVWGRGAVCTFAHLVSQFPCEALAKKQQIRCGTQRSPVATHHFPSR